MVVVVVVVEVVEVVEVVVVEVVVELAMSAVVDSAVVVGSGSAVVEVAAEGSAAVGVGVGAGVGSDEHAAATTRAKEPITAIKIVRKHIYSADVSIIAMQPYSPSVVSGDEHCPVGLFENKDFGRTHFGEATSSLARQAQT